jgi:hypothetical protein
VVCSARVDQQDPGTRDCIGTRDVRNVMTVLAGAWGLRVRVHSGYALQEVDAPSCRVGIFRFRETG